jgi:hypothetical protein
VGQWTPGPWKWKYDGEYGTHKIMMGTRIKSSSRYQSHHEIEHNHCIYPEDGEQFTEAEANISLMCASPEIYAELNWIVENLELQASTLDLSNAKKALAKARGEGDS